MMSDVERDMPIRAQIDDEMLWVTLRDGRIIATPIAWYPFLVKAESSVRQRFRLKPNAIWWDELDEGLSIQGMLAGGNTLDESPLGSEVESAAV